MELAADFAAAIRGVPKEDLLSEEVRQQRRALTLAWSAVALLIALAGAAAWQWKSALEAERIAIAQKQRAEKDLGAAKGAVNDLIFNIAQGLGYDSSTLPVSTIHHILDTVKATIESLAATEPGDTDLQRSRLTMLGNFAETYLKAGDLEDAQKAAEESLALAQALAKDKGDAEAASDLSVSYHKVGDVLQAKGDLDGALTAYRASLAIAERLAQVRSRQSGLAARSLGRDEQDRRCPRRARAFGRGARLLPKKPRHQREAGESRSRKHGGAAQSLAFL